MQSPIKFFSGSASRYLAEEIVAGYNTAQAKMHLEAGNPIETLKKYEVGKSSFTRFSVITSYSIHYTKLYDCTYCSW